MSHHKNPEGKKEIITRIDTSDNLVHLLKGYDYLECFNVLCQILRKKVLLGSNQYIKGKYNCICFTETSIECLSRYGFVNKQGYSRYRPFGIIVKKDWLFGKGGRPVIYQPEDKFYLLPEEQRWRHVTYDPTAKPPVDFSWEREWRINQDKWHITPEDCSILVPDSVSEDMFTSTFKEQLEREIECEKEAYLYMDTYLDEFNPAPFPWSFTYLNEYS